MDKRIIIITHYNYNNQILSLIWYMWIMLSYGYQWDAVTVSVSTKVHIPQLDSLISFRNHWWWLMYDDSVGIKSAMSTKTRNKMSEWEHSSSTCMPSEKLQRTLSCDAVDIGESCYSVKPG